MTPSECASQTQPLRLLIKACTESKCSDPSPKDSDISGLIYVLLELCQEHLPSLGRCSITNSSPLSVESGIQYAGTHLFCPPSHASMLAGNLQHLTIDVASLLVLRSPAFKDTDTCLDTPPIVIPRFPNRQFSANIDLELPRSLVSLELRANNENELHTALLSTLAVWSKCIRTRFPALQWIIVALEKSGTNRTMFSRKTAADCRIEVVYISSAEPGRPLLTVGGAFLYQPCLLVFVLNT